MPRKEDHNFNTMDTHAPDVWPTFDADFWPAYRKGSKKLSRVEFDKLKQADREAAQKGIEPYFIARPDPKFRKDGERYLKHRVWEDPIVTDHATTATNGNASTGVINATARLLARRRAEREYRERVDGGEHQGGHHNANAAPGGGHDRSGGVTGEAGG